MPRRGLAINERDCFLGDTSFGQEGSFPGFKSTRTLKGAMRLLFFTNVLRGRFDKHRLGVLECLAKA